MRIIAKTMFRCVLADDEFVTSKINDIIEVPDWLVEDAYFQALKRAGKVIVIGEGINVAATAPVKPVEPKPDDDPVDEDDEVFSTLEEIKVELESKETYKSMVDFLEGKGHKLGSATGKTELTEAQYILLKEHLQATDE